MENNWGTSKFRDLYAIPSRNGLTKPKRVRGEGVKFINMGEIFKYNRMKNIPTDRVPVTEKEFESSELENNDLLFARQSLVLSGAGKCSIFLGDREPVVFESHLIRVRPDKQKVDPNFLYYFFQSPQGRSEVWAITEQGAGQAGIRGSDLEIVNVPVPPPSEQKAIAHILGSLDDKIELNRQMNETLESMAQALFKSWFVDFDPVIDNALAAGNPIPDVFAERAEQRRELNANAEKSTSSLNNSDIIELSVSNNETASSLKSGGVSFNGSENSHQSLFPSEFEFAEEMGWIPKGWNSTTLGDFAIFGNGKTSPDRTNGNTPVFGSNGQIGLCDESNRDNTIIIGRVGSYCGSLQYYPSKCWITDNAMSANMENTNHNIFLYQLLSRDNLNDRRTGSGQPLLNQSILRSIKAIIPTSTLIDEYSRVSNDFFRKKDALNKNSSSLEGIRNTLLPKLLSGEIRIPDTEKLIEEASV